VDACEAHYGSCSGFRAIVVDVDAWLKSVDRTDAWSVYQQDKKGPGYLTIRAAVAPHFATAFPDRPEQRP
jgi:hypothetical protein